MTEAPNIEVFGLARPVMAYAVMPDNSRQVIRGWTFEPDEDPEVDLIKVLNREARFMGGLRAEIALTDLG
jgi:hypothetical protein